MRLRLVLCLAMLAAAAPAAAEDWQPVPGDAGSYFDNDFLKVDETTGMVVMRYAMGRANGPYKGWPAGKSPIMVYALECNLDSYKDLGLDFEGKGGLPKGWRSEPQQESISLGVGAAGTTACERKDALPKAALP